MRTPRCVPVLKEDPAGLDKLLLAFGKGIHDFAKAKASNHGVHFDVWSGKDGLEETLKAVMKDCKVPNKRLSELFTPRSIAERAGVLRNSKRRIRR